MPSSGLTPGGKVRDKLLFLLGTHMVMHDKLQIVIQHPKTCPGKGSPLDKRKTFHRWQQAAEKLETCGVVLDATQQMVLRDCTVAVAVPVK